jgi:hypothetical protein
VSLGLRVCAPAAAAASAAASALMNNNSLCYHYRLMLLFMLLLYCCLSGAWCLDWPTLDAYPALIRSETIDPVRRESKGDQGEFLTQETLCGFTLRNPFSGHIVDLQDNIALMNDAVRGAAGQHFFNNTSVLCIPRQGKSNAT